MNDFMILNPVDNTDIGCLLDKTYEKGYSEYRRLFIPNQATDDDNNIFHYIPYGSIALGNKVAVDKKNLLLKNGFLLDQGLIVEKYYISKQSNGILLGDEKYFRVIDSTIDQIKKNNLVIVMDGQSNRFNLNKKEYFHVRTDKVLIYMNESGIHSGTCNMLLKHIKSELLGTNTKEPKKGSHDGNTYYFSDALYDFVINHESYAVVAKKDILVVD